MELAGASEPGLDVLSTLRFFLDSLHTDLADDWTRPKQRRESTTVAPREDGVTHGALLYATAGAREGRGIHRTAQGG